MTRTVFFAAVLCFSITVSGQQNLAEGNFAVLTKSVIGDLNKDGLADSAVVTQDTVNDKWPYRLQVYFQNSTGNYTLAVSTDKAITPRYTDGKNGYQTGDDFSTISIANNVLTISFDLLRGHYDHKFRYQNGNFELIGYSGSFSDGRGELLTVDFNLSTGWRLKKKERYDNDKLISNIRTKHLIRPLPKLQDFEPGENELY